MSLDVLLGLQAAHNRCATRRATRCHVYLAERPFVVVGYHVPGDPGSPLGILCGTDSARPHVIAVGEPRDHGQRWQTLTEFALDLNGYLSPYLDRPRQTGRTRSTAARRVPQLVVANTETAQWLCQELGLLLRYLKPETNDRISPALPIAGAHLSFFDQQRVPGASLILSMTEVLALHWRTGQLPALDSHLASQLAWIRRPESILDADRELPAGPVPDAIWERGEFTRTNQAFRRLTNVAKRPQDAHKLARETIRSALLPAWTRVWEALTIMGELPPAEHVEERSAADVQQWRYHADRVVGNRAYFLRRPRQLQVFRLLNRLERLTANLDRQMALDDPLVMARYVTAGEALSATVVDVRLDPPDRARHRHARPTLRVKPDIEFTRPVGTRLWWQAQPEPSRSGAPRRPTVEFQVNAVGVDGIIELTVVRNAVAPAQRHRLPGTGVHLVFAPFEPPTFRPDATPDELPWTHREPEDDA